MSEEKKISLTKDILPKVFAAIDKILYAIWGWISNKSDGRKKKNQAYGSLRMKYLTSPNYRRRHVKKIVVEVNNHGKKSIFVP